jgi:hypothetical protein
MTGVEVHVHRRCVWPVALVVAALLAAPARGAVGVGIGSSAALSGLAPGTVANTPNVALAVNLSLPSLGWSLRVAPSDGSSPTPGRMRAANTLACASSTPALASGLKIFTSSALPSTTVDVPVHDLSSGGVTQIAHGVATDSLVVVYKQPVGTLEQLSGGCTYSVGVAWTVIGS